MLLLDRRHQGEDRYLVLDWLPFHQPKRSWSPDRPYWFAMLVIDCTLNLLIMKSLVLGNMDMVVDRRWEQEAVEFMSLCEHRSQTNQPWRILPMFDLSPPTQSCVTTGPWYECCRTWTDAVQPKRLQRLRHESVISTVLHNIALIQDGNAAWEKELKIESYTEAAKTMYSRRCEKKGWVETSAWRDVAIIWGWVNTR